MSFPPVGGLFSGQFGGSGQSSTLFLWAVFYHFTLSSLEGCKSTRQETVGKIQKEKITTKARRLENTKKDRAGLSGNKCLDRINRIYGIFIKWGHRDVLDLASTEKHARTSQTCPWHQSVAPSGPVNMGNFTQCMDQ